MTDIEINKNQAALPMPTDSQNLMVPVTPGLKIQADFNLENVAVEKAGQHIILRFEQGGTITLENVDALIDGNQSPTIAFQDGSVLSADQLLSLIGSSENELEPAAGEPDQTSGGVGEYGDDPGDILGGIGKLDGLDFDSDPSGIQNFFGDLTASSQSIATLSDISIELDPNITADDNISNDEIGQLIPVTGSVGRDVQDGEIVELTVNGQTYSGPVKDGRFSIDVPGRELANDPDNEIEASVTAKDPIGNNVTATDTETYTVGDVPAAVDDTFTATEDTPLSGDLSINDTPSSDGGNVWTLGSGPSNGTIAMAPDGTFTYTPNPNYNGPDSFTYTITDANGDTSTATANITVDPVDDLPLAVDDTFITTEDNPLSGDLSINDTPSIDGGNVWALASDPSSGTVTIAPDGTFTYTPNPNYNGPDSFTYTITDADGSVSTATVNLTVDPANDTPVAVDDNFNTEEDVSLQATVADNDINPDGGGVYALVSDPSNGSAIMNPDGTFTYTPDPNYNGPDSFTYTLTDADGDTSTATAVITVGAVDDPSVLAPDSQTIPEDTTATGNVLENDSDIDSNLEVTSFIMAGDTAVYSAGSTASIPGVGTLTLNIDGSYIFTPEADWNGDMPQVTYTTNTGASTTLDIEVTSVNESPVGNADTFATVEGVVLNVDTASGVLSNDTDADNDPLTVLRFADNGTGADSQIANGSNAMTTSAGGTVVMNSDGSFEYTAPASLDHSASDTLPDFFYYQAGDGQDQSEWTRVDITVEDTVPTASNIQQTLEAADGAFTYNLVIVLDRSGSMELDVNGNDPDDNGYDPNNMRMDIAKAAIAQMIAKYDQLGNVNVQIVDFAQNANESNWFIDDMQGAVHYVNDIQPDGGTRYTNALDTVMDGYNPPVADKTVMYFISDGDPNVGYDVDSDLQIQWEDFVSTHAEVSYGVGIGEVSLDSLLPIAYPNTGVPEDYAIKLTDASQLSDTLLDTVEAGEASGDLTTTSESSAGGIVLGADGGRIDTITIEGTTYTYDANNPEITITTPQGGTLTLNFESGEYTYQLSSDLVLHDDEVFAVTAVDGDGDTVSMNLTIQPQLDANNDLVLTNVPPGSAVEIPDGALLHNDSGSNKVIDQASDPVYGTVVDGNGQMAFTLEGTGLSDTAPISITNEQAQDIDSSTDPRNNTRASAADLTDRSLFGRINNDNLDIDAQGYTMAFRGRLNNDGGDRDVDYVKVQLYRGENLFVDIDEESQDIDGWVEYQDANGAWQSIPLDQDGPSPQDNFSAPENGEYFIRLQTDGRSVSTDYDLLLTITADSIPEGTGSFSYQIADGEKTDETNVDVRHVDGNTIAGGDSSEVLAGGNADDTLEGEGGNDALVGNGGNDILVGGEGDDLVFGGVGNDTSTGGQGKDSHVFSANGGEGNDTITDFNIADDVIRLTDVLDADGDSDIDINDLLQPGGQEVAARVSATNAADVELTISNGSGTTTVVTLSGINVNGDFNGVQTLSDLINNQGLHFDIT